MGERFDMSRPIYAQIVERLKAKILAGVYPPGGHLDSVRDMAAAAGVNPNTMQRALAQLEAEGLVYTERTTGRFVTEDTALLEQLRDETARAMTAEYLEKMRGIGYGPDTKAIVSYLPDAAWLPDWMRVEQLVEMFRDFYADFDPAKANEMLEKLELSPKAPLKSLSKGNKEKVQLILAMSRNARLYLLDEPIGGVDPAARDYILNTILTNYSRDASVIISTHLIEDVEPVLDEAVFLKNGRIFAHRSVDELRETEGMSVDAYFREVFKC